MKRSGFNAGALSFSRRAAQGRFLSVDIGHPCIADQPPKERGPTGKPFPTRLFRCTSEEESWYVERGFAVRKADVAKDGTIDWSKYPLAMSRIAVQVMMKKAGLSVPDDVLAFASNGTVSDADVKDWSRPETP